MTSDGKLVVNEKTWDTLPSDKKLWMLYDTMQEIDRRLERLERKSLLNKTLSIIGGIFGGAATIFGGKMIPH